MKLGILVFFLLVFSVSDIALASKPTSPLKVLIEASPAVEAGAAVELTGHIHAFTDINLLNIELLLPAGVQLLSGEPKSSLAIGRGDTKTVTYRVQLPEELVGKLVFRAWAGSKQGVYFSSNAHIDLGQSLNGRVVQGAVVTPFVIKDRDGEKVKQILLK